MTARPRGKAARATDEGVPRAVRKLWSLLYRATRLRDDVTRANSRDIMKLIERTNDLVTRVEALERGRRETEDGT